MPAFFVARAGLPLWAKSASASRSPKPLSALRRAETDGSRSTRKGEARQLLAPSPLRFLAMPEADELLTVAEVATMLKLNQQTIRNYIDRNELPCVRVGRRVRIKRPDLDQLIQAGYKRLRGFAGLVDDGRILLTGWAASGAGAPAPATFVQ